MSMPLVRYVRGQVRVYVSVAQVTEVSMWATAIVHAPCVREPGSELVRVVPEREW